MKVGNNFSLGFGVIFLTGEIFRFVANEYIWWMCTDVRMATVRDIEAIFINYTFPICGYPMIYHSVVDA